ncbi:hypothetical protein M758_10G183500 [Ceratodon purpureus]|uniref:Uncharacterized protein n=1 Tax=Ceratodon purpureus TaxID=3225 RepID=A0A8T0GLV1_CERPU|nr:hypothetical protein KC19_10G188200 [Ceratodon purpureus]KAG0604600.1 hypothetical protein M758_10G183500 [Ceratodon purpureus]
MVRISNVAILYISMKLILAISSATDASKCSCDPLVRGRFCTDVVG